MLLKVLLLFGGAFVVFTGLDMALGGIKTMGWLVSPDFVTATKPDVFAQQDSHVRFFGGIWAGIGLFMWLATAIGPERVRDPLLLCLTLIFVGGLARLSALDFDLLLSKEIVGSLALELIGMPLLIVWLLRMNKNA